MDKYNYQDAKYISGKAFNEKKSDLLLNLLDDVKNKNVPDPWYGGESGFHDVFSLIDRACDKIISKYK